MQWSTGEITATGRDNPPVLLQLNSSVTVKQINAGKAHITMT
jgi:hypothetical protein